MPSSASPIRIQIFQLLRQTKIELASTLSSSTTWSTSTTDWKPRTQKNIYWSASSASLNNQWHDLNETMDSVGKTGFPRIKYGAGWVKPGMTDKGIYDALQ
jgi:hypothetical protein